MRSDYGADLHRESDHDTGPAPEGHQSLTTVAGVAGRTVGDRSSGGSAFCPAER